MGKWRRWRRFRYGTGRKYTGFLLSVCIGILLASACIHWINASLRPQMLALAEAQVANQITRIANDAIGAGLSAQAGEGLLQPRADQRGDVLILSTDAWKLNELRRLVTDAINEKIMSLDRGQLDIPLGSVTGLELLAGLGPGVPIHVLSVSVVEADFHSELQSAGLNQSLHRLLMDVGVRTRLLLPGYRSEVEVRVPLVITETLISGAVPRYICPH